MSTEQLIIISQPYKTRFKTETQEITTYTVKSRRVPENAKSGLKILRKLIRLEILRRAVASRGARKAAAPPSPRPVELDTSSLWMDLFSLDSVNFDLSDLHIRGRFFGNISHDKS